MRELARFSRPTRRFSPLSSAGTPLCNLTGVAKKRNDSERRNSSRAEVTPSSVAERVGGISYACRVNDPDQIDNVLGPVDPGRLVIPT
jgi:hypothetical protein